jgi:hypothetical protein
MARFAGVLSLVRSVLVACISLLIVSAFHAQITNVTDDTSAALHQVKI